MSDFGRIVSLPNAENHAKTCQGTGEILWYIQCILRSDARRPIDGRIQASRAVEWPTQVLDKMAIIAPRRTSLNYTNISTEALEWAPLIHCYLAVLIIYRFHRFYKIQWLRVADENNSNTQLTLF